MKSLLLLGLSSSLLLACGDSNDQGKGLIPIPQPTHGADIAPSASVSPQPSASAARQSR